MSSFFTLPASQRKRKRPAETNEPSVKRYVSKSTAQTKSPSAKTARVRRDESISGSESDEGAQRRTSGEEYASSGGSSESEEEDETGAERRLRLAERYLENIKGEVDEAGFDAEEIDRDLIAERLKEDAAEAKGRLFRRIASHFNFPEASSCQFRADTLATTSIATCLPYVYTVSKDLTLIKWELPTPPLPSKHMNKSSKRPPPPTRRRPKKLMYTKGNEHMRKDPNYQHHTDHILCVAASSDGRFVATGGKDRRLIIWSAADLSPLRVFNQHRDAVTGLAFRRGTNQLYSSSKDRTIKTWSLNELAYVETLFGHQDEVVDVAALSQERCVSIGARDRTARLWKVVEETQLVFRGGGGEKKSRNPNKDGVSTPFFAEGSIDRVAMVDEENFVTGSDNGSISLWNIYKKKPVFILPMAHGLDPALKPEESSAEQHPDQKIPCPRQPRWITALATVPYSDLFVSGSWDGWVRIWKISEDKRRIEAVGVMGKVDSAKEGTVVAMADGRSTGGELGNADQLVRGVINDMAVFERGDKGKDGLCIVAAVGTEHRFGRWKKVKGKNGAVVFEAKRTVAVTSSVDVEKSLREASH